MRDFIRMSHYAGMREDLVQAGGGNSAYKISADRMAIKASGYQLTELTEDHGISFVNPEMITEAFFKHPDPDHMTEEDAKKILQDALIEGERPSIETFLHSIAGTYTLHTHPIAVNILLCRQGGEEKLKELFSDAVIIPYATPGVELAKVYFREIGRNAAPKKPRIVFLMNHGLLVSGDSAEQVMEITERTVRTIEEMLGLKMQAYHNVTELWKLFQNGIIWNVTDFHVLETYRLMHGTWPYTFCPDCVVFLGKKIWEPGTLDAEGLEDFRILYGEPVVILYHGQLYIHAQSVKKALEIQSVLSFSAQVMLAQQGEKCRLLSEQEQDFLLQWEAEKYRKNRRADG